MATPTPTPSSSRHRSRHPSSTQRQSQRPRATTPPLPAYEAPIAPLHSAAQIKLLSLLKSNSLRPLKTHLQHAEEKLTDSAGEVNERLTDARVRLQRLKERRGGRENFNEGEEDGARQQGDTDDWEERLRELEERVGSVTERLEGQMRGTIDGEVRVDGLVGVLGTVEREVEQESSLGRSTRRTTRRRGGEEDGDDDEDGDYEEAEEERGEESVPPSRRLDKLLGENYADWDKLSLTERYSSNNAYIGFYRIIHEAKHPGEDIPPLPHASTWFSHLEDPTTASAQLPDSSARRTRRRRSPSPADSDEIAIESERISLKCPLTLLYFRDPVTSSKCPHSFEREAIEDMIAHSSTTVPAPQPAGAAGRSARRVRSVKCPVCSVVLTAADLRPDPVLVRRVRRHEAALRREAEEDELSDGARRRRSGARKSGITLVDDDGAEDANEMDVDSDETSDEDDRQNKEISSSQDHVRIKQEMSTAPVDDD
ncbi:zinc-finger of the MIZ type in Nse subunit-domain-containing protein [Aspergillus transmontanensis]|uniref:Zinc-finger of the MIZ type in Nse subunit-domain-containing protein n=1 Tax=Aspergillus transmontanensis TaxID=1034304 RepID=A0A5N6WG19_9EURO|nr:zinc-finger of the MIZ type in Nse subunit-domain-containing protein [Aspergillus transmontanensis]